MTANEMLNTLKQMDNTEKNEFLDMIYNLYFDKGVSIERLTEEARILEAYYDGELVEAGV